MSTPTTGAVAPQPTRWVYRCASCGRVESVTDADVVAHLRTEFPRCCRKMMPLEHMGCPPDHGPAAGA